MSVRIIIKDSEVRLSYANIWTPRENDEGDEAKYGTAILIPKSDTATIKMIQDGIKKALEEGKGKFGGKIPPVATLKLPLRDGDAEKDLEKNPEYAEHYFLNANSKRAPQIVGPDNRPITDENEVYSGCYAHISFDLYAYNHPKGGKGVAAGLGNIQKVRDGDALGGAVITAEDDFGPAPGGATMDFGTGGFGATSTEDSELNDLFG
ncbi:DUF2815 family protein [Corynebacterium sp. CCUG 18816]|uniref:DUF2815 family protein n=1 Tax=Corynebacterium pseudogenitalium TaxID=38303 RepID=UPI00210D4497|nr:DUF2815 family protein [Corynebacterium pseudogenitalium]MCQ4615995.1 DUF2815 family protein [Corynebacterium pseudogenitalium]